jgi:uncharacterized protein YfaS (alpha-2-macroglobulin family)
LIQADVYSDDGRYGMSKQVLVSSKDLYSKLSLPSTAMTGDFLKIPITVTNNKATALKVEVVTRESYSSWSKNTTRDVSIDRESTAQTIF